MLEYSYSFETYRICLQQYLDSLAGGWCGADPVTTDFDEYIPTTDKVMALDIFSLTFSVALWEEMARDPKKPFFNITQMVWACPLVSREQIKTARHDCIFNNIEIFRELWNLQDMLTTISKFDLNSFWV